MTGLFLALLTAGFVLFLLFRFAAPEPGFPYYQFATPVFLSNVFVSVLLVFKGTSKFRLPVRIGLVAVFGIALLFLVPVQLIVHINYETHCGEYFTNQEWKSVFFAQFQLGVHFYYHRPDYYCLLPIEQ